VEVRNENKIRARIKPSGNRRKKRKGRKKKVRRHVPRYMLVLENHTPERNMRHCVKMRELGSTAILRATQGTRERQTAVHSTAIPQSGRYIRERKVWLLVRVQVACRQPREVLRSENRMQWCRNCGNTQGQSKRKIERYSE